MSALLEVDRPKPGLRERKKAKTRAAIQAGALLLFRKKGYEATTVDEIAEAAEVSPSTFFRYFPTKEDVVMYDELDPILFKVFAAQPAELSTIAALRAAMREVFGRATPDELAKQNERAALIFSVPELRMRMLDELVRVTEVLAGLLAKRIGRQPDDFEMQALAGAVVGVGIAAWINAKGALASDYVGLMDKAFAQLEEGFNF
jgi:AcrR family transcriptional regulator